MNRRTFIASTAALAVTPFISIPAFAAGRSGTFKGQSNHVTTGSVTVKDGKIILGKDFDFDGAPDPRVALGNGGKFKAGSKNDFAVLKKDKGSQTYSIPSNMNEADFDTVIIWCRKFTVPLGYAKLK